MTEPRSPSPLSPVERRYAVLTRLLAGEDVKVVASALRVPRQRVHEDVSHLVNVGVLRRLSGARQRLRVEAGDVCAAWLRAAQEAGAGERRGRSGALGGTRGLSIRLHHWGWSRAFSAGPTGPVPWTGSSTANRVVSSWLTMTDGRHGFQIRAYAGPSSRRLQVRPEPVAVASGPEVVEAERAMGLRARAVGEAFARRYGFALLGDWRQSHPTEYAGPVVPGLERVGAAGVDEVWGDKSPDADGSAEIETRSVGLAAAWADLPRSLGALDARIGALESNGDAVRVRLERLVALMEGAWAPLLREGGS